MNIVYNVLSRSGHLEIFSRAIATSSDGLKKRLKSKMKAAPEKDYSKTEADANNRLVWETLKNCGIRSGDIVIIHSASAGLKPLQLTDEEIMNKLLSLWGPDVTIVFPTFRMENQKVYKDGKKERKYNPDKGICWTGILPNVFLRKRGISKSRFPFNTLSAVGPQAEAMMEHDLDAIRPHDRNSPWFYCYTHHAKILMIGITSREANTMSEHMAADVMEDEWPISDWYESLNYKITLGEQIVNKTIEIQKSWSSKYVISYKQDRWMKKKGLVRDISTGNVTMEIVDDARMMLDTIIQEARKGNLPYLIPKKYWK